jgi:hypothetical protein
MARYPAIARPNLEPTLQRASSFAEWQAATTALCTDVAAHGAAFRTAAQGYLANDGEGAGKLDQQF